MKTVTYSMKNFMKCASSDWIATCSDCNEILARYIYVATATYT